MLEWRPGAGRRTSTALIPIVGHEQGRQCGRDHTTICVEGEPAYERCKTVYAQRERERERERERGTKNMFIRNATVTT